MNLEEEFLNDVSTSIKSHKKVDSKNRINSKKKKGNRGELELTHILNERFEGYTFARSVQSGAYIGQSNAYRANSMTEEQKLVFAGDIRVPINFKFTIEHKAYAEASFWDLFNESSDLHSWMKQAEHDAESVGKQPMLIVKYNNKKRIAYLKKNYVDSLDCSNLETYTIFSHNGWYCFWLEDLLKETDSFFFEEENNGR